MSVFKPSWSIKVLLSSSLVLSAATLLPYEVNQNGIQSSSVDAATSYTTTVNLNLRKSASTRGTILLTIPSGARLTYLSTYGSWYRVTYNGQTGYVASQYVKTTTSTATYVTTANLNLRKSASTRGTILFTIPSGRQVTYISSYGSSWYRVSYNGTIGYVSTQYLKPASTTSSPTGKTVVIDAGHGGNDPGAVYGSVQEKVIALDIAKRLSTALTNTYGYNVRLTRTTDTYLSLAQRVSLTKTYRGNVFVSLHANSSTNSSYHGHEVLVPTGESYTTNPYISASRSLGSSINRSIASRIPTIRNRGVKYQNVYVVGKNSVPSTLVEYGFINNSNDRSHLTSTTYRQRMAEATAAGIHRYMQ